MSDKQPRNNHGFISLAEALDRYLTRLDYRQRNQGKIHGVPTGFLDIDNLLGGFQDGELIILAARSEAGIETLALQFAIGCAQEANIVAMFTSENAETAILQNLIAIESGISNTRIDRGGIDNEDRENVSRTIGSLTELPVYFDDTPTTDIPTLQSKLSKLRERVGLHFIQIDYRILTEGSYRSEKSVAEGVEITRQLKILARQLQAPILLKVELPPLGTSRPSYIPMLADLRSVGLSDEHCDIVMLIYREELYDPETEKKGLAELHIAKHRNGPRGVIPLHFSEKTGRFIALRSYRETGNSID